MHLQPLPGSGNRSGNGLRMTAESDQARSQILVEVGAVKSRREARRTPRTDGDSLTVVSEGRDAAKFPHSKQEVWARAVTCCDSRYNPLVLAVRVIHFARAEWRFEVIL
jgi:hypothetical protein